MGVCSSAEAQEQGKLNKTIERQITKEKRTKKIKLLLLGTADCGKSTVLKQMRILHEQGFKPDEIESQKGIVYSNLIQSMGVLIHALETSGVVSQDIQPQSRLVLEVIKACTDRDPFSAELVTALRSLWADADIQLIFQMRRTELQIPESSTYFFAHLDRVCAADYVPNSQDILFTRIPTNGIVEVQFTINQIIFRVFDVGGQRSERRKWIHCFDDVNAVIFMTACSEYDQKLVEDEQVNRMHESIGLFNQIANSKWFADEASMIVFMNKKDLFEEKIKRVPLTVAFPKYTGEQAYEPCLAYIEERYKAVNEKPSREVYIHRTCATDTDQVQLVLDSVMDTIMQANLANSGLIAQ